MVQNKSEEENAGSELKRRGRPRAYDPDAALLRALEAFWKTGYSGTSLDDLSAATGMNRPSLYAAFGDKRALYLKALDRYFQLGRAAMAEALSGRLPLNEALTRVYETALSIYFADPNNPCGCFAIGTATTEAVEDAQIRAAFAEGLRRLDASFETRLCAAQEAREVSSDADPVALAMLASATLHSIAIRARAGTPRAELEEMVRKAIGVICRA